MTRRAHDQTLICEELAWECVANSSEFLAFILHQCSHSLFQHIAFNHQHSNLVWYLTPSVNWKKCPHPTEQNPYSPFCKGGCPLFFITGPETFKRENMTDMYLISVILASFLIIPFALKTFSPFLWMDILYCRDLLRILVTFVSRRRRRPFFLVLDRFLEQTAANPDKLFIVFENERYSYTYTDKRSNKTANALQSHPGYEAGDTVALFMGNEPAFVFTWLALAKLGSPVSLLNHNIRTKSLLHCFNCCKAKVLIAASGLCTSGCKDCFNTRVEGKGLNIFIIRI